MISEQQWRDIDSMEGWMARVECEWLYATAGQCDSWTEIGCWSGRSSVATGLGMREGGLLQLVDPGFQAGFWDNIHYLVRHRPDLRLIVAQMNSEQAHDVLKETDVVFIDGHHLYENVAQDIRLWWNCQTLCGHDYSTLGGEGEPTWGVTRAVNELVPGVLSPAGCIWRRP
jgi:hypothetical protein